MELLAALPTLEGLTNFLRVAIGLSLVVFFHELGHYAVAKWCNVFVERFSIGFGPILFSRKWGETEYAISAIPFGGYVKMLGQDDMDSSQMTDEEIADDPRSYTSKKVWQRMAIISAGVIMNVLTAVLFYVAAYMMGVEQAPPVVGHVAVGLPAWEAGLQTGDEITQVNDKDINSFTDLKLSVALSNGPLDVKIKKTNGDVVEQEITPDESGDLRILGIGYSQGLRIPSPKKLGGRSFTIPGSGAARAEPAFEAEDVIRQVGDQEVSEYYEMEDLLAERASETLDFYVQRKDAPADELTKITVPPTQFLELGLVMDIGAIKFIKQDSPAQKAGLKIGDKIVLVNERQVGPDIDPLRLSEVFSSLAGEKVVVYVRRESGDEPDAKPVDESEMPAGMEGTKGLTRIELTPQDISAWTERPATQDSPMTAPSIGIAYEITRTVLSVTEGSPADGQVEAGDRIQSIAYLPPEPEEGEETSEESKRNNKIEFADAEHPDRPTDWAYPFWLMQELRDHQVQLTISRAGESEEVTLKPVVLEEHEWYLPIRGFVLDINTYKLQTDDVGEAFSMGINSTQNKALEIFLTLRSLVRGDVSITNLQGPVGIAKAAYTISSHGMGELLAFLGFLSVNLAVLNFLPIPILDGGHMVFLCWEGITGQKPSQKVIEASTLLGMIFLLLLVALVMYMDIFVRILGWGAE
ncbi:MAG: RIP metalloprotease RseP [Planctomycetaceae bacterium]|nr:RIP metalloprotease RseP [Planctomycetaceae bacterium]